MIKIDWLTLKNIIINRFLEYQDVNYSNKYLILAYDKRETYSCVIKKTNPRNVDQIDYEDNYQSMANQPIDYRIQSDTFTEIGNGIIANVSNNPMKYFSIQLVTNGIVTLRTVDLQVSSTGIINEFTTIASHVTSLGSGKTIFVSTACPALYFRARCIELTLTPGSSVTTKILGMK